SHVAHITYHTHVLSVLSSIFLLFIFFFFNAPAPPEIYTLSLHDALPILAPRHGTLWRRIARIRSGGGNGFVTLGRRPHPPVGAADRKSTRLNSSHVSISYAVFCLKKKKKKKKN